MGAAGCLEQHVLCWQLFVLGRPAVRAALVSPAASAGWDTRTWCSLELVAAVLWVGKGRARQRCGVGDTQTGQRQPTKMTAVRSDRILATKSYGLVPTLKKSFNPPPHTGRYFYLHKSNLHIEPFPERNHPSWPSSSWASSSWRVTFGRCRQKNHDHRSSQDHEFPSRP